MRKKSISGGFQKQLTLEMCGESKVSKQTSSLSDSLVRIYQSLENGQGLKVLEAVCSMKRQGLFVKQDPVYLSLKTSKDCLRQMTLSESCERLPTLGFMSASGNCLILAGYYPRIESGYTLSEAEKTCKEKVFSL